MEPTRIEIDGVTYELRPWSADDGERWLARLIVLLGKIVGSFASEQVAVGALLGAMDEATLLGFWSVCRKYTARIGADDRPGHEGDETVQLLSAGKVLTPVPYFAIGRLIRAHAEAQYSDFFGRLPELLGMFPRGTGGSSSPPA